jgi:hypothetical protein
MERRGRAQADLQRTKSEGGASEFGSLAIETAGRFPARDMSRNPCTL